MKITNIPEVDNETIGWCEKECKGREVATCHCFSLRGTCHTRRKKVENVFSGLSPLPPDYFFCTFSSLCLIPIATARCYSSLSSDPKPIYTEAQRYQTKVKQKSKKYDDSG